ncbi:uncharacterized protein LOC112574578 [Pomacea canaliculata]|uniref:uncharacterized protein LOC112574578 n=1 Tax=Pomacea canaliculata TaxID=400727 RepID=UPI000D72EBBF|nr:uncharacterized protein LOC112574578 [Pomacea canaliculata]
MTGFWVYSFIALAVIWSTVHANTLDSESRDELSLAEFLSNRKKNSKEDNLIASRDLIAAANPDVLTCYECVLFGTRGSCLYKLKECGAGMLCGAFIFETGNFYGCMDPGLCRLLQSDTRASGRCCSESNCNM